METFGKQDIKDQDINRPTPRTKPKFASTPRVKRLHSLIRRRVAFRSLCFSAYSFGGGYLSGVYYDVNELAWLISQYSGYIYQAMIEIGRSPIGTDTPLDEFPPSVEDEEWLESLRHRYAIYLEASDLKQATQLMVAMRETEQKDIKIGELTEA
jgi:hypothetical protein